MARLENLMFGIIFFSKAQDVSNTHIHVVSSVLKNKKNIRTVEKIKIEITLYDKFGILVIHTKNDETISPR